MRRVCRKTFFYYTSNTGEENRAARRAKKIPARKSAKIFLTCIDKSHYDDYYLLVVGVLALDVIEC
ncbi:hypothetical protein JS77_01365 [Synergistes jonesii]|uniref:Uncharacterized protein n=1 Tax=Synergistes jonesii TaxID=2754 RepID=A0A073J6Q2_9BACT|nr:hypothetical protein [Synergistes jonesii]KEJ93397.1 hypothetical protein EH55_08840 [Synergistes jonesii]OFB76581.1 hypothetical protein JS77_01365 [Synergistes jonesii]